jgi:hypothetical protein
MERTASIGVDVSKQADNHLRTSHSDEYKNMHVIGSL